MNSEYETIDEGIPDNIPSLTKMELPNEAVPIFQGDFLIKQGDVSFKVSGSVVFDWFPEMGAKFQGVIEDFGGISPFSLNAKDNIEIIINNVTFGKAYISGRETGATVFIEGVCNNGVLGDRSVPVSSIRFCLANLRDFFGENIKEKTPKKKHLYNGRQTFDNGDFIIVYDKLVNYKALNDSLKSKGGYVVVCSGEITRHKGVLVLQDVQDTLHCFANFLYFLNGRRTSGLFLKGMHEGETIWTDYSSYTVDIYKSVQSWSQAQRITGLNKIWRKFSEMWKDDSKKDFLNTVVHWYVEANSNAAYLEGSIILAQTALELIYNWLLVEQKQLIIGNDATNLSASNKIRLVISQLNINPGIPTTLTNLSEIKDMGDGPEVFVYIRNCLVHGQEKKRRDLMAISQMAKFEALQLGIWYIELALLNILDYDGNYFNRTSGKIWADTGELVPWAKIQKLDS